MISSCVITLKCRNGVSHWHRLGVRWCGGIHVKNISDGLQFVSEKLKQLYLQDLVQVATSAMSLIVMVKSITHFEKYSQIFSFHNTKP